ncbi:MAG: cytochrome C oxidase subunit IV family protein [Phycisphaerales bacterium]|nr:cytochrome C oxidase subunit IV family protein [Phycisphaerales bacterium]
MAHAAHAPSSTDSPDAHNAPHGAHHGHHIVPRRVLLTVFGLLLFFTLTTVGAAQFEQWIATSFDVVIPQWVNVAVALSIAVVKTVIVGAFFMQLKYDSPVNSLVVLFTLMCFACFIGFTAIDLGNRDALFAYKSQHIKTGGTGGLSIPTDATNPDGSRKYIVSTEPIVIEARKRADATIDTILSEAVKSNTPLTMDLLTKTLRTRFAIRATELIEAKGTVEPASWAAFLEKNPGVLDLAHSGHGGHGGGHAKSGSSAAMSRPTTTLAMPKAAGHSGHDSHSPEHTEGAKPAAGTGH